MLHSVLITYLLSWCFSMTGTYETGVAVFTILQMILLAAMFSNMICGFYRAGCNKTVLLVQLLYCALFPVIHVFVTCTVRDIMFSGLLTYFVYLIYTLFSRKSNVSQWEIVRLAAILVLTIYSRNNNTGGFLTIVLLLICFVIAVLWRNHWRRSVLFLITVLCLNIGLGWSLGSICQPIAPSSPNASMALFTQSIGRAYVTYSSNWSPEDQETMIRFFGTEDLPYVPSNGDMTKNLLQISSEDDKSDFIEFWLLIGKRHPEQYLKAILENTMGMWFPGAPIDGYQKAGIVNYRPYDKCFFGLSDSIEMPATQMSLAPKVRDWYSNLCLMTSFEKIPFVSLAFSIASYFWLLLLCCFYNLYRNNTHLYFPLLVLLGYMVISAFVPLILARYFAAIFFSLPLMLVFLLQAKIQ